MTSTEFDAVVSEVKAARRREFATASGWNDHESHHLPHDLPPVPAPAGVDAQRYESLVY